MIPGLAQWVKNPELLWLWCRPAAAAVILPLAWEPPCAMGAALKKKKKKRERERERKEKKKKTFPRADITKYHKLNGFKRQISIVSQFWRLEYVILGSGDSNLNLPLEWILKIKV